MATSTQRMSPSAIDSIGSRQSDEIPASLSITTSLGLSLATSESGVEELTSHVDFFSSSSSTYLTQSAFSSISEWLTVFPSQSIPFQ